MTSAAHDVVAALVAARVTVGTAESLTGGLVCGALTDVPGSSAVVRGGVVAYAVPVKRAVLGVPASVIEGAGVVSRDCALAMAEGVRTVLGCDWGVSTTGVAGPGPADGWPAGTVHVAVVGTDPSGEQVRGHRALSLDGSRAEVRAASVEQALGLLAEVLGRAGLSERGRMVDHHETRPGGGDGDGAAATRDR